MNGQKKTVVYITREIERALGIEPNESYRIVANRTVYGESVRNLHPNSVVLIDSPEPLGTSDLIRHADTARLMSELAEQGRSPHLIVFKNTARIEPLAHERGWKLLNPSAATSEKIENKITQISWLGALESYLPAHRLMFAKDIAWRGTPFVIQWAHGHTGGGTFLINSEAELAPIKEKFPDRRSRISDYIAGPSFTINAVAAEGRILASSPSYQITGLSPFTDGDFSTIGNDWSAAREMLTDDDRAWLSKLTAEIGQKMLDDSWRGLFGIDVMKDATTGQMYLIEINARQPASTTFESALQEEQRTKKGSAGLTTFEAHLMSLLGQPISEPLIEVTEGAQIIQRVTDGIRSVSDEAIKALESAGFEVVSYQNSEPNADLLRIQSRGGIITKHSELNEEGLRAASAISGELK